MLTIKEPMRLQSISVLRTYSDILGEKIAANYRLIGTEITSADLLHMAVQAPEQFLNMEYHGMLTVGNHIHADNRIKLELINQLLNRVMLCFTPEFTYQDEVFVASVLQKMGIADVNEFMQQIHRHMDRNVLLNELINHYFSHGSDISGVVEAYRERYRTVYGAKLQEVYDKECRFVPYLHYNIFERLMTAECNNIIYSYNCHADRGKTDVQGIREAVWIEQADAIQLSRLREILFHQTNPAVWQNDMYYEIKTFEQAELTEEKVIQRMAAAVLENMIQKIHCGRLQYRDSGLVKWKDYKQFFYQSAEEVFERFWYFQTEKIIDVRQRQIYVQCMLELIQDERMLTHLLKEEMDFSDNTADIVLSIWENQNIQKLLGGKMWIEERLAGREYGRSVGFGVETEYREFLRVFQEIDQIFRQEKLTQRSRPRQDVRSGQGILQRQVVQESGSGRYSPDGQEIRGQFSMSQQQEEELIQDISRVQEARGRLNMPQEQAKNILQQQKMQIQQEHFNIQETKMQQSDFEIAHVRNLQEHREVLYDYINEFLRQYEEFVFDQSVPFAENARLLEQVNQHNLYMKQLLDSEETAASGKNGGASKRVVVDQTKARRSALRAMENPQEVLREIYGNASAIEREAPQEIERILRITDEKTRRFYKRLLGYHEQSEITAQWNNTENDTSVKNEMDKMERFHPGDSKNVQVYADNSNQDTYHYDSHVIENALAGYIGIKVNAVESNTVNDSTEKVNVVGTSNVIGHSNDKTNYIESNIVKYSSDKASTVKNNAVKHINDEPNRMESNAIKHSIDEMNMGTYSEKNDIKTETAIDAVLKRIKQRTDRIYQEQVSVVPMESVENRELIDFMIKQNFIENSESMENSKLMENCKSTKQDLIEGLTENLIKDKESKETKMLIESPKFYSIGFVHKPEQQIPDSLELHESGLSAEIQSDMQTNIRIKLQSELDQIKQEQIRQKQLTQQLLQDVKRKLTVESEEQITRMVNRNLKTQVYEISDIVYHELERRLKNEQRRRGY